MPPVNSALPRREPLWWSDGLRFACIGCGRCCRGEPGAIFFTPGEEARVVEHLGIDLADFRRRFVTGRWGRPSFIERSNGDCVFYDALNARCSIYAIRPAQCRLFPFWPEVLKSSARWDACAKNCPGMNDGRLYTPEDVAALAAACASWMDGADAQDMRIRL